jgi:hypothetical protein
LELSAVYKLIGAVEQREVRPDGEGCELPPAGALPDGPGDGGDEEQDGQSRIGGAGGKAAGLDGCGGDVHRFVS